jgi:hypothetical protein
VNSQVVEKIVPLSEGQTAVTMLALKHLQTSSCAGVFVVVHHEVADGGDVLPIIDLEG